MRNIEINDGYERFMINKDPNRVLVFNPCDVNIIHRLEEGVKKIEAITSQYKDIELKADGTPYDSLVEVAEAVNKVDKDIRSEVDKMFNSNASDALFGKQSPLSMVSGIQLWESALMAVIPAIKTEVLKQQKIRREKIDKYVKQVK